MSLVQDLARVLRFGCCYDIVEDFGNFGNFIYLMNVEKFSGYSKIPKDHTAWGATKIRGRETFAFDIDFGGFGVWAVHLR